VLLLLLLAPLSPGVVDTPCKLSVELAVPLTASSCSPGTVRAQVETSKQVHAGNSNKPTCQLRVMPHRYCYCCMKEMQMCQLSLVNTAGAKEGQMSLLFPRSTAGA
jgi:hypothetical protein